MLVSLFAAVAAAAAPQVITHPAWLTRPSAGDFSTAYPAYALKHNIAGEALITCVVNVHGLLEACQVVSESPPDDGFGRAALLLAPRFSMTPASGPDGPVAATVNIPIGFKILRSEATRSSTHAEWIRAPRSADMVWPGVAWYGHISGRAVLDCVIASNGKLKPCAVVEDAPKGRGFADAAISFLEPAKMRPPTVDGAPVPDAHVHMTVDFDGAQRCVTFAYDSQ
jgi:TonB family protein